MFFLILLSIGSTAFSQTAQKSKYFTRTDGACTNDGGTEIKSISECKEASPILGVPASASSTSGNSNHPPGCFQQGASNPPMFNVLGNEDLYKGNCVAGDDETCLCTSTCQPGTYQDQTGQTSCKSCETGRYQDQESKSSCKTCADDEEPTGDKTACEKKSTQAIVFNPTEKTSGKCTDDGGSYLTLEECKNGASALGWTGNKAPIAYNWDGYPRGCFYDDRFLNFNNHLGLSHTLILTQD